MKVDINIITIGCISRPSKLTLFFISVTSCRVFNIFQVYPYFTIYRGYFFLKFEHFAGISYATLFEIRRYQLPF
jgi:hypothetical protein